MPLKLTLNMSMLLLVGGFPYQRVLEEMVTDQATLRTATDDDQDCTITVTAVVMERDARRVTTNDCAWAENPSPPNSCGTSSFFEKADS